MFISETIPNKHINVHVSKPKRTQSNQNTEKIQATHNNKDMQFEILTMTDKQTKHLRRFMPYFVEKE